MWNNKPTYTNVYASYAVTPASERLLQQFSRTILHLLQEYPMHDTLQVKVPSHFHATAQYAWLVSDVDAYIAEIKAKIKHLQQTTIACDGVWAWQSNIDASGTIFAIPQENLPFEWWSPMQKSPKENLLNEVLLWHNNWVAIPHLSLVTILPPDNIFWIWFWMWCLERIMEQRSRLWEGETFVPIEIDTSKIQIRWRENGEEKRLLVEV